MIKIFTEQNAPNKNEIEVFTNRAGEEYSDYILAVNKDGISRLIYYNFTKRKWILGHLGDDYSCFCNDERRMKFAWMYIPKELVCE